MHRREFLADGWRLNLVWLLIGVFAVTSVLNLVSVYEADSTRRIVGVLAAAIQLAMIAFLVWGLTHRRRPIVEIANGMIRYGALFWTNARKIVGLQEVASVRLTGTRLELLRKNGDPVRFWLGDLSQESREMVRAAIEHEVRGFPQQQQDARA